MTARRRFGRAGRCSDDDRLANDAEVSAREIRHAETGEKEIQLAHPLKAGYAEDLSCTQPEGGVAQLARGRDALGRQNFRAKCARAFASRGEGMRECSPGDHAYHFVVGIR